MKVVRQVASTTIAGAIISCLAIFTASFVLGYLTIDPEWVLRANVGPGVELHGDSFWAAMASILGRNIPAVLLLFSGAVTAGFSSVLSLGAVGVYVGATFRIGAEAGGLSELVARVGPYIGLEFGACVVAAAAGLIPVIAVVRNRLRRKADADSESSCISLYLASLPRSLNVLAVAGAMILVAAAVESAVIIGSQV